MWLCRWWLPGKLIDWLIENSNGGSLGRVRSGPVVVVLVQDEAFNVVVRGKRDGGVQPAQVWPRT